ncbi:MAG: glycosyltransferase family 4 protein [Candidatus Omnitrophota bacterium]|jgi:glycosyltransferase involved in cell wall biosynthesis
MKVVVLGTRGFPNVQGGVEKHCEHLYSELIKRGCEVTVFTRMPYMEPSKNEYKGVKLISLKCPRSKHLEAFVHTFQGVLAAKRLKPDILHIHAVGPSLFVPLAYMMGFKVIMTHHGPDYERKKWNLVAKFILRLGEKWGCRGANRVICVSSVIAENIKKKFNVEAKVIPNGVIISETLKTDKILKKFNLEKSRYILAVGRFVPEKGFVELIEAFRQVQSSKNGNNSCSNWKLVIAGDADHEDKYSLGLKELAKKTPGVIMTGFLYGQDLQELYSHAGLFMLPSYYEGLPIVLLEAMGYGLSCLASDIPANRSVELSVNRFFTPGDIGMMAEKIKHFIDKPLTEEERTTQIKILTEKYNWDKIAEQTLEVYKSVIANEKDR